MLKSLAIQLGVGDSVIFENDDATPAGFITGKEYRIEGIYDTLRDAPGFLLDDETGLRRQIDSKYPSPAEKVGAEATR